MSVGEVVFNIVDGYDADMWDDSLLIRQYDRACQASRELKHRKHEAGKRKKNWELGDGCRVVYQDDGLEYEATIVKIAGRKTIVRLHGYKEELEVPIDELTESLGQQYIMDQIAEAQMEVVTEDPYTGPLKSGQYCRAFWSLDGSVYEGRIESMEEEKVTVRFIGYDNEEIVMKQDLLQSKGKEWRDLQIEDANDDFKEENNHFTVNIDKLVKDNSNVLSQLDIHSETKQVTMNREIEKEKKSKLKVREKEKSGKHDKISKPLKSDNKEKDRKVRSNDHKLVPPLPSFESVSTVANDGPNVPLPLFQHMPGISTEPPLLQGLPNIKPARSSGLPLPSFHDFPPGFGVEFPEADQIPALAPPPPAPIPVPGSMMNQQLLNSMLISWYLAGYHTGIYQASSQPDKHKKKK